MGAQPPGLAGLRAAHGRCGPRAAARPLPAVRRGRQFRAVIATYTRRELMVVAAAREIRDGEVVFVGMPLPLLGFGLAKATHAPNAVGLVENGVIRHRPADAVVYTICGPPNPDRAVA